MKRLKEDIDYYWSWQSWYKDHPKSNPTEDEVEEQRNELFKNMEGHVGIDFNKYDDIKVTVGGEDTDSVGPLRGFRDLQECEDPKLNWKVIRNIQMLKWQNP